MRHIGLYKCKFRKFRLKEDLLYVKKAYQENLLTFSEYIKYTKMLTKFYKYSRYNFIFFQDCKYPYIYIGYPKFSEEYNLVRKSDLYEFESDKKFALERIQYFKTPSGLVISNTKNIMEIQNAADFYRFFERLTPQQTIKSFGSIGNSLQCVDVIKQNNANMVSIDRTAFFYLKEKLLAKMAFNLLDNAPTSEPEKKANSIMKEADKHFNKIMDLEITGDSTDNFFKPPLLPEE